jgi:hypothetical protein
MRSLLMVLLLSGASVAVAQNSANRGGGRDGRRPDSPGRSGQSSRPSLPMPGAALPTSLVLLMLACRRIIGS